MNWSWVWCQFFSNPNITCDIIELNPDLPWHWEEISKNKNLTEEFFRKNISKLNLMSISDQLFTNKLNILKRI